MSQKIERLVSNFSIENLNSFLRSKITSYQTDSEELDYIFDDNLYEKYESVTKLGEADIATEDLIVIASKTNESLTEKTGKKNQYNIAKKVIKHEAKDAALFVFYDDDGNFRFSFVKVNYTGVKKEFTEFKRYTYFVTPKQTNKTFKHQIDGCNFSSLEDIVTAFSVEPLNKLFYQEINKAFYALIGGTIGSGRSRQTLEPELQLPNSNDKNIIKEFGVRLIGRTIFCWFLKNKKSQAGIPLVPESWLSSNAVKENYYHNVLEKLFFLSLNKKLEDREPYNLPKSHETIPFLNGGLFEPHIEDYFNNKANTNLIIPDTWFKNLFNVLEQFNFTIDENSTSDAEVSIDPEMLGTIFENLLAEIDPDTEQSARKSTGSFYTPREIVDYMVEQSLVQYLKTKTTITDENQLLQLFREGYGEHEFDNTTVTQILEALSTVTILDPACGSGAFPMGAVQKIVLALKLLDPKAEQWKQLQLNKFHGNDSARKKLQEKLALATSDYARKLGVIQNAIYGVDIQSIATDISKLRSFLSLVIDENIDDTAPNRGIEPLPNLEFKFVTANTLISLPNENSQQAEMFVNYEELNKLQNLRNDYFQSSGKKKDEIKERFINLQKKTFNSEHHLFANQESRAYKLISWNPFSNNSSSWFDSEWMFGIERFDIVLGNPPYVQIQKLDNHIKQQYQAQNFETFKRTGDIYGLFYEKGVQILKEQGVLCYITSNKWMRAGYGDVLRAFFANKNPIKLLDFAGFKVFESATVDTNILLLEKAENKKNTVALHFKPDYKKGDSITQYVQENAVETSFTNAETWAILSLIEQSIKQKIEQKGTPLKDWDINIYRGILTGYNEAFIITGEQRKALIEQDPNSAEILKPILRGRDIKKYTYDFADLWLIATHNGYRNTQGKLINRIDIKNYPAIKQHLDDYWDRVESRYDQGDTPYNLRNCAYFQEFEKEKICWASVGKTEYSFIPKDFFLLDTNYFFTIKEDLKYLTPIFNSKPIVYWINSEDTPIGQGGAYRHYKYNIEKLSIPRLEKENTFVFTDLFNQIIEKKEQHEDTTNLEKEIDQLVYKLYGLNAEEIAFIENEIK